jgi:hypothetical protein
MSFFDLFRKKRKAVRQRRPRTVSSSKNFLKVTQDIQDLQAQTIAINTIMTKHEQEITQHGTLLEKHTGQLDTLEQLVTKQPVKPTNIDLSANNRSDAAISLSVLHQRQFEQQNRKFDIAQFSEQEKRILSVFFQNKDMTLSYADLAMHLGGKSPNTIKNQMRQISMKADLFNCAVGNESRKRFKLKEGIKIEKYLGISEEPTRWPAKAIELDGIADRNRPDERPVAS